MGPQQQFSVYEVNARGIASEVATGDALRVVLAMLPRLEPDVLYKLRIDEIGRIQRELTAAAAKRAKSAPHDDATGRGRAGALAAAADAVRAEMSAGMPDAVVTDWQVLPAADDDESDTALDVSAD